VRSGEHRAAPVEGLQQLYLGLNRAGGEWRGQRLVFADVVERRGVVAQDAEELVHGLN
jgi:hypothetical protein